MLWKHYKTSVVATYETRPRLNKIYHVDSDGYREHQKRERGSLTEQGVWVVAL